MPQTASTKDISVGEVSYIPIHEMAFFSVTIASCPDGIWQSHMKWHEKSNRSGEMV